jgi:hypothetical protein
MGVAIISCLLAALAAFAALRKLSHRPEVVAAYTAVDVPEEWLDALAALLLAGAAGLIVGLLWAPIGIAAAAAFVVYFLVAIAAHVRAGDTRNLPTPILMVLLAVAALVLRLV